MFFRGNLIKICKLRKKKLVLLLFVFSVYISLYNLFVDTPIDEIYFDRPLTLSGDYIINDVTICRDVKEVTVLVVVHSAVDHYQQRHDIRSTYGSRDLFTPAEIRVIFLLGRPGKFQAEQNHIREESKLYGDIIQGNFLDTYRNLTHKAVMGLRWVSENCRNAKYILKVDDDAMFDMWKFVSGFPGSEKTKTVWCHIYTDATIQRKGKWAVPSHQFPGLRVYPFRYCAGFVVIMTGDIVPELFKMSHTTPYLSIDDVYVYGMLLARIKDASLESLPRNFDVILSLYPSIMCQIISTCRENVAVLATEPAYYHQMWNSLRKRYRS